MTLIEIQDRYIRRVNAAVAKWSASKNGGHLRRTKISARREAEKSLEKLGFTNKTQIATIIQDAKDIAELERMV